jgi:hypothetical protein
MPELTHAERLRLTPEGKVGAKKPKPDGAWTLHFTGGSLADHERWWSGECPLEWAYSKSGLQERYRRVSVDEAKKLAVYELVTEPD